MVHKKRNQHGATLIETMLVLVIAAMLIVLGIRQYKNYKQSSDVEHLNQIVDTIFQAMSNYYRANCFGQFNPQYTGANGYSFGNFRYSTSSDSSSYGTSKFGPVVIDITNDLLNSAATYLDVTKFSSPLIQNPIDVGSGEPTTQGYYLQFSRVPPDADVCTEGTNATGPYSTTGCTAASRIGSVILWKMVVIVEPATAGGMSAETLMNLTGATCTTEQPPIGGSSTDVCSSPSSSGTYVAWIRSPMAATTDTLSSYSISMPALKAFTQMYRADTMPYLSTEQPILTDNTTTANNFIYCTD